MIHSDDLSIKPGIKRAQGCREAEKANGRASLEPAGLPTTPLKVEQCRPQQASRATACLRASAKVAASTSMEEVVLQGALPESLAIVHEPVDQENDSEQPGEGQANGQLHNRASCGPGGQRPLAHNVSLVRKVRNCGIHRADLESVASKPERGQPAGPLDRAGPSELTGYEREWSPDTAAQKLGQPGSKKRKLNAKQAARCRDEGHLDVGKVPATWTAPERPAVTCQVSNKARRQELHDVAAGSCIGRCSSTEFGFGERCTCAVGLGVVSELGSEAVVGLDLESISRSRVSSRAHSRPGGRGLGPERPSEEGSRSQRPARSTRGKRRPDLFEVPSKEEEAMLRRALANSLAITRREQTAFDLIAEAPVYAPSEAEFADPVEYLESIRSEAERYGLCKVIPPEGWQPPFSLDPATRFKTRLQKVHRLQQGEGFKMSREYSWEEYKKMAMAFEEDWIRRVGNGARGEELARILEREFWRIVETGTEEVEVEYGSDLMVGSGFSRLQKGGPGMHPSSAAEAPYARSPWNLLNLPRLQGSLLRFLEGKVPGVTVPWLYIGMLFTAFCFHTEDNFLYSVNYHHLGAPKTWYGVPAAEAAPLERAMRQEVPALFADRPDLLHQLVTAVSPIHLLARKVQLYRLRQLPGEFVITYPMAYHCGFNHGFNCAEAVNFAPPDWLPFGAAGTAQYRRHHKTPVLNFDELLCRAAHSPPSPESAPWLAEQLAAAIKQQAEQREAVAMEGTLRSRPRSPGERAGGICAVCQCTLYLAGVTCSCRPRRQACLQCAAGLCGCGASARTLVYTLTLAELEALLRRVKGAARGRPGWKQRPGTGQTGGRAGGRRPSLGQARLESYRLGRAKRVEQWVGQARQFLEGGKGSPSLLLEQAEEFLWGGSDMAELRSLARKLQECQPQEMRGQTGAPN